MATKCSHGRRKGTGVCRRKPGPKRGRKVGARKATKHNCRFGVNKVTGRCLKNKRSRKR